MISYYLLWQNHFVRNRKTNLFSSPPPPLPTMERDALFPCFSLHLSINRTYTCYTKNPHIMRNCLVLLAQLEIQSLREDCCISNNNKNNNKIVTIWRWRVFVSGSEVQLEQTGKGKLLTSSVHQPSQFSHLRVSYQPPRLLSVYLQITTMVFSSGQSWSP